MCFRLLAISTFAIIFGTTAPLALAASAPIVVNSTNWCHACATTTATSHRDDLSVRIQSDAAHLVNLTTRITISGPGISQSRLFVTVKLRPGHQFQYVWQLSPRGDRYHLKITFYRSYGSALSPLGTTHLTASTGTPWRSAQSLDDELVIGTALALLLLLFLLSRPARVELALTYFSLVGLGLSAYLLQHHLTPIHVLMTAAFALSALAFTRSAQRYSSTQSSAPTPARLTPYGLATRSG